MKLKGKNILITGAGRGLGLELANRCWEEGANLFLHLGRELDQSWAGFDEKEGQKQVSSYGNLCISDSPELIRELYNREFGEINGLVNNAAMQGDIGKFFFNWNSPTWKEVMQTNFFTPMELIGQFSQNFLMTEGRGKIVNLSGGGATSCRPNYAAYATSKAALNKLGETLAKEFTGKIDINSVAPGIMYTGMAKEALVAGRDKVGDDSYFDICSKVNDMEDGENHSAVESSFTDAVDLIVFLLSEESDGITGKIISAIWDEWKEFPNHVSQLQNSNAYTMRRVVN